MESAWIRKVLVILPPKRLAWTTAVMNDLSSSTPVRLPALPRFRGGAVGFLGYAAVRRFERLPTTPAALLRRRR